MALAKLSQRGNGAALCRFARRWRYGVSCSWAGHPSGRIEGRDPGSVLTRSDLPALDILARARLKRLREDGRKQRPAVTLRKLDRAYDRHRTRTRIVEFLN